MVIKPVLHRLVVKPDNIEDKDDFFKRAKEAGIMIHRDEREREQAAVDTGIVLDIGATAFKDFGLDNPPVKVGERIVYARYAGKTIIDPVTKDKFVALNDEDVVAIVS